jgi:glycopeptide antibiotics resistance protein
LPRAIEEYRLEPHFAWIATGIAVAILYGSFYPFGFYAHHDPRGPLGVLLDSGLRPASQNDVVSNVLLYIPFGFFAAYALEKRRLAVVLGATLAGFALSLLVELLQFYDMGRYQEISDICSNTVGALLGAAAAAALGRRLRSVDLALLLFCWFGSRCYPASPPAPGSSIPALDLFRFFTAWLVVGLMMEDLFGRTRSRVMLPLFLVAVVLLRALVVFVEPAEIAGGAAAALLWSSALWRVHARAKIAAALFVTLIVLLALAPFHFSTTARAFSWVPFRSFLAAGTETAIRVFFEKAFLYGGMVWLIVRAGFSIGSATAFGAMLVFGLRILQVYLPGRSAEITDAILLLMLAAMMKLISLAKLTHEDRDGVAHDTTSSDENRDFPRNVPGHNSIDQP